MVDSTLTVKFEEEDRVLLRVAAYAAGIMQASGNYKKSTSIQDLIDSIYRPLIPIKEPEEASKTPVRKDVSREEAAAMIAGMAEQLNINAQKGAE